MGLQTQDLDLDRRMVVNVGGVRHETWLSTLERLPDTRLGILANLQESDESYDPATGEYFFDRHPRAFDMVINYYRTEELHAHSSMCGNVLRAELEFWGIEEQEIEACCWADYSKYTEHKQTLRDLDENFAFLVEDAWETSPSKYKRFASQVWRFLEEPGSSRAAKMYAITSMFFVGLSITVFVLETHKLFQVDKKTGRPMYELFPDDKPTPTGPSTISCCCEPEPTNASLITADPEAHPALQILDYICVAFFTLEIIVRFAFCPDKWRFWKAPLNIIDFVCLIPHFASIIMKQTDASNEVTALVKTIMMLRIVRILRIFKLMKHYNAFKILVYTIKVSTKELLLMIVFLMSGVLMFAAIIHYTEQENFPNIPIAIWWALVTMTTVGYGDKYPVDYMGYCMGSLCVICGVLVIAFTVPIVVNNFSLYYSHAQTRIKAPRARKKKVKAESMVRMKPRRTTSPCSETDNSRFTALSADSPGPGPKTNDKKRLLERPNTKENNLNIREEEKPQKHKHVPRGSGKQAVSSNHGQSSERKKRQVTPVERIDREDSGYAESNPTKKKLMEEETEKIMAGLATNNQKMADERKRQEWLIRQKRDARAKKQAEKEDNVQEVKGKSGEGQKYNNPKDQDQSEA